MKTCFVIGFVLGVCVLSGQAQVEFSFSGYCVDLLSHQKLNRTFALLMNGEQNLFINITRVRLRPALSLSDNALLSAEYEIAGTYNVPSSPLLELTQSHARRRQLVDMTWQPISNERCTATHFVDRLFLKAGFEVGDFIIGRQRIAWGTGRIWNPTDLFNPLSPTTFSKIEKDGVDAVATKFHLGSFTDLMMVWNAQKNAKTNWGARFRTNVSGFDLSVIGGYFDERVVAGGDFAGNLFDAGVRGEMIVSAERGPLSSNFVKLILGADYQFTPELYGVIEYHFNGEGAKDKLSYELQRLLNGEILNLSRHYFALSGSYLVHPLLTASLTTIVNGDDGSKFFGPSIIYSVTEEISVCIGAQLFSGDMLAEYWYYPNTMFLKGEIYF